MKAIDSPQMPASGLSSSIQHALFWLVLGNAIGSMLAVLLLLPQLNPLLGEWTYGRWMMVHMNVLLYGWCGLPMLGFLFSTYKVDRGPLALWARPVVWLWSSALIEGSYSWLQGHSSGRLFLDWTGTARVYFPLAMAALWCLLAVSFFARRPSEMRSRSGTVARVAGLVALAFVPFAIFFASGPNGYPAVNPDSGGPTGASQLESSLAVALILLLVPIGIARRQLQRARTIWISWLVLAAEAAYCISLGGADVSHRVPAQFLGLGLMLVWIPMIPVYYAAFAWNAETRRWRTAMFWWWGLLVSTGWLDFLPGVLDRLKFTDALVGHSLIAVAGFLTALLALVMVQLIGDKHAWILNRSWSFNVWNYGVLAYVVVMMIAGWVESSHPAFTIVPGAARNTLYVLRLVTGLMMLAGSVEWFVASRSLCAQQRLVERKTAGVMVA